MKLQIDKVTAREYIKDLPSGAFFDIDGVPFIKVNDDLYIGIDSDELWVAEFNDPANARFTEYHGTIHAVRD